MRKSRIWLQNILIALTTCWLSFSAIAFFRPVSFTTADDTPHLYEILEKQPSKQVLGASTEDIPACPEDKPIIGWINYSGEKVVVNSLPQGTLASICFANLEEAKKDGYE